MSEQILSNTSAQLGYTASFHTGSRWKIQMRSDNTETKYTTEKLTTQKKQNKTTLVQSLHKTLGQETTWAYSTMLLNPHGTVWMIKLMVMSISLAVTLT